MIAYHEFYPHPLPENHKFPMMKYSLLKERLLSENIFNEDNFFEPELLSEEIVSLTHDQEYIDKLKYLKLPRKEERRLGFPQSKRLFERELYITDGTLKNSLYALKNGVSFNIAGGTHHAFINKGEGFCLFNDIAVAANYMLRENLVKKVLVVDLDVHQGNGTAEIFNGNNKVFTFSMHGKNNYPLIKEKSDLDIELEDNITDEFYLNTLSEILPMLISKENPDIIYYQAGVDVLESDKFGRLSLTINGCKVRDEIVFKLAKSKNIPLVCVMGGGYSSNIEEILEAHLNTYRTAKSIYS